MDGSYGVTVTEPSTDGIRTSIAANAERAAALLADAVRQPTLSGDERLLEPLFSAWFAQQGWRLERQVLAETAVGRSPRGLAEPRMTERANLIGWLGEPRGREVVTINAHYDVVPVIDLDDWDADPFSGLRRDGAVFGRGAVDNKGGCVAAMLALRAIADAGVELAFDLAVELIAGEETTGLGTMATLEARPTRIATIVMEPTDNAIVPANSGVLFFTIAVDGRAVHTSVPWRGEDALKKLIAIYRALDALGERRAERRHPSMEQWPTSVPLVVGTLTGGGWRAAVPAHASMSGRIGILPGEEIDAVRQELIAAIDEVVAADPWLRAHPPRLQWDNDGAPGWELDQEHELVQAMEAGQAAVGMGSVVHGITAGCDAGVIHRSGIPVVVFGPGDMARAHSPNEYVLESEVLQAAEILAVALVELSDRIERRTGA